MTPHDSSQMSVSRHSDSASGGISVGVGAFPPLGGVGAVPDCSGEKTFPLGLGVATGVDEIWGLKTLMGNGRGGGSR